MISEDEAQFCEHVRCRCVDIAALILAGQHDKASNAALMLAGDATTRKEQGRMEQEAQDTDRYDLRGLAVEAGKPSNSETSFEND